MKGGAQHMRFNAKQLKLLGIAALVLGGVASLATSFISDEKQKLEIADAAKEAVDARISEIKGA